MQDNQQSKTPSRQKLLRIFAGIFILTWIIIAAIGGPYFGKLSEVSSTDLSTFLPGSAESSLAVKQLERFNNNRGVPLVIVYEKNGQEVTTDDTQAIKKATDKLSTVKDVKSSVPSPVISDDKKAAISIVSVATDADFQSMFPTIKQLLKESNLAVSYTLTGPASFSHDLQGGFAGIDSTLLFVAVAFVFVILLLVYRSPFLPVIVLISAVMALAAAVIVVYHLADSGVVQLNGQVQGILFILVIGAATDYSLLYIARYREELTEHELPGAASLAALKASFPAIVAAGGTVSIGLLCLLVSDLGSNKALGPVGGIGIAISVLATLTLLPSLLFFFGRGAFWPKKPHYLQEKSSSHYLINHPVWARIGSFVKRYPRPIWLSCVVLLTAGCLGILQLKANGVPQSDILIGKSEARDGQKILDKHFAAGFGAPAYIIVDKDKQPAVIKMLDSDPGVSSVSIAANNVESGSIPVGKAEAALRTKITDAVKIERDQQLASLRGQLSSQMVGYPQPYIEAAYTQASAKIPSLENLSANAYPFTKASVKQVDGLVFLQAVLTDPADSFNARDTIIRIRENLKTIDQTAKVGGVSAAQYDTNIASQHDLKNIAPLILLSITIILMFLLRAIVAPIVLLLSTILSFGATMGISALVFNHVWNFAGAEPTVIIMGFVFLVALGIDYNIFLMTRVREETVKLGVTEGTIKGLVVTGGVITSAGIVLAATFAALNVIPVLYLVEISFIVTFGVLLDTIIVRSLLVPAATLEIGRIMWWPSRLSRLKNRSKH